MSRYHAHLDECGHCACNPFDLCPVGVELQAEVAAECRPQLLIIETPIIVRPTSFIPIVTQTAGYDHHTGSKKGKIKQQETVALAN